MSPRRRPKQISSPKIRRGSVYGLRNNGNLTKNNNIKNSLCKQRLKYIYEKEINEKEEINSDLLFYLQGVTWDIFRLTPLKNISYQEIHIKKYAARIKQALARLIQGKEDSVSFITKILDIDYSLVDSENNNDYKSLQIEVYQKKEKEQLKYKGVLLNLFKLDESENLRGTPLLFCTGSLTIKNIVNSVIQEMFNTFISPIKINENDLFWISTLAGFSIEKSKKDCQFLFNIPSKKYSQLKILTVVEILDKLWRKICGGKDDSDENLNEITLHQIETFKNEFCNEIFNCYNIHVDKLILTKVILPSISIQVDGKIKFHSFDKISTIINFFQDESFIYFYNNF